MGNPLASLVVLSAGLCLGAQLAEEREKPPETAPPSQLATTRTVPLKAKAKTDPGVTPNTSNSDQTDTATQQPLASVYQFETTPTATPFLPIIIWPFGVLLFGLAWILIRKRELVVSDSRDFNRALAIWLPVISKHRNTPRAIKRFLNRTRYYAMRPREEKENLLDEPMLIAVSAIYQMEPEVVIEGDLDQVTDVSVKLGLKKHLKAFGDDLTTDYSQITESFKAIVKGMDVH